MFLRNLVVSFLFIYSASLILGPFAKAQDKAFAIHKCESKEDYYSSDNRMGAYKVDFKNIHYTIESVEFDIVLRFYQCVFESNHYRFVEISPLQNYHFPFFDEKSSPIMISVKPSPGKTFLRGMTSKHNQLLHNVLLPDKHMFSQHVVLSRSDVVDDYIQSPNIDGVVQWNVVRSVLVQYPGEKIESFELFQYGQIQLTLLWPK